jgi:type I restriction enzyme S subunit
LASKVKAMTTPVAPASNGSLPKGWRKVRFGDVVRDVNEAERSPLDAGLERFVGLEHIEPENLHLKQWGLLADGEISFTKRFRKGQVLFGKRRAYQRKVAVAEFDGICSSDILTFEPKDDSLIPELLPFIVQSEGFFEHALGTSSGSLSPRTRWSQLQDYEFPLPPKDEQRRIADMLWAADELCLRYSGVCENALHLTNAIASDFFSRKWPMFACEKLFIEGPRNGLSPNCNAEGRGFPTLAIGAVREGRVVAEGSVKFAEISREDLQRFRLRTGDVLVVRGNGNRNLCGRSGVVEVVPDNCFFPDLLIRLSFDSNVIDPDFAVLQWNTPTVHSRLLQRAKSTNGIWKINGKDLREHTLAVPPYDSQKKFMLELDAPNAALAHASDALKSAVQLMHQLIIELLRGPCHVQ